MLIDLYYYIKSHDSVCGQTAVEKLSDCLSRRAILQGYSINSTFRNINGIKMKIQNIEYIATNGSKGLSSYSRLDYRAYNFSVNEPKRYKLILDIIKKKFDLHCDNVSCMEASDGKIVSQQNKI